MATADHRITTLESDVRMVNDSVRRLCEEAERDRRERRERDKELDQLLHGKDNDNPGLLIEVDRLKSFKSRLKSHVAWLWGALGAAFAAIAGSVAAWWLNNVGGKH